MKKILLFGPSPYVTPKNRAYGQGVGGYTSNMRFYLEHLQLEHAYYSPCFHTYRGQLPIENQIFRLLIDTFRLSRGVFFEKPSGVHIFAQYRNALPREFIAALLCTLTKTPFFYDIKAGAFIDWHQRCGKIKKAMVFFIIKNASSVFAQGHKCCQHVSDLFSRDVYWTPNVIRDDEIPRTPSTILQDKPIKILFVGYCFYEKGVLELIEGAKIARKRGIQTTVTIVGAIAPELKETIEAESSLNSWIELVGPVKRDDLWSVYAAHDVYLYPTRHSGEGHNNTINEALAHGLLVVTTKQGFLGEIITDERGYSLDCTTPESIANALLEIAERRKTYRERAKKGRHFFLENFTQGKLEKKLDRAYQLSLY